MNVALPDLKRVLLFIISFEDSVDEKGRDIRRKKYKPSLMRAVISLKEKLSDDMMFLVKTKDEVIEMTKDEVIEKQCGKDVVSEKYSDAEIELTKKEIEAFKHYYKEFDEVPDMSLETLDALEELIK